MISEGGAQAFQSNSAVNGLVQNSCIWKAKPQHLKPTPCFSTDNDGHLGYKKKRKKPSATSKCYQRYLNPTEETLKSKLHLFCEAYILKASRVQQCKQYKAGNQWNIYIFYFCLDSVLPGISDSIHMSCCVISLNYLAVLTCILLLDFRANGPRR